MPYIRKSVAFIDGAKGSATQMYVIVFGHPSWAEHECVDTGIQITAHRKDRYSHFELSINMWGEEYATLVAAVNKLEEVMYGNSRTRR